MTNDNDSKNILVIRLSALGDVVRTLPAVVSISQAFPGCRITWVTETLGASFVEGHPAVEKVLVVPTRAWRRILLTPLGFMTVLRQLFAFVRELRSIHYDIVVDFHGVLKSAVVCSLARTEQRVGYDSSGARELSYLTYTETVHLPKGKLSRYTRNMKLAEHLGGQPPEQKELIHEPASVDGKLLSFLDNLPKPIFTVHPGTSARAPYKRWFVDRYVTLCDKLARKFDGTVVLTCAPDEREFVSQIGNATVTNVRMAPQTETPLHLAYILSRSDMYIGSDTGAMHIATLAGTPVVGIWGPTDPVENEPGPYSPHQIVRKEVNCSPCRKMRCLKRKCMAAVEVNNVLSAVEGLLEPTST